MNKEEHHPFGGSSIERVILCPGSHKMNQDEEKEGASAPAIEGTFLHKVVETGEGKEDLTVEQELIVNRCNNLIESLCEDLTNVGVKKEVKIRIFGNDNSVLAFGTADVVIVSDQKTIVIDWKFGRAEVEESANNYQMAFYSLGVMQKFGLSSVEAHVFQPRINHHSFYEFSDKKTILSIIENGINKAKQPGFNLLPGEKQCKYCKSNYRCPAAYKEINDLIVVRENFERISKINDTQLLSNLYPRAVVAEKIAKSIQNRTKQIAVQNGICGDYTTQTKPGNRVCSDSTEFFNSVKDIISGEEFAAHCKVSIGAIEDIYARTVVAKAKEVGEKLTLKKAKEDFREKVSGCMERQNDKVSLVKITE